MTQTRHDLSRGTAVYKGLGAWLKKDGFVLLLLAASLALNVRLGWQVRQFEAMRGSGFGALKVGASVPPLIVKDLSNKDAVLNYAVSSRPTVLYIFTPTCRWCEKNIPNMRALFASGVGRFSFVGVSLTDTGLKEYLAQKKLEFTVYSNPSMESMAAYQLGSTPQTIVISSDGRIVKNWIGAYAGGMRTEIEQFFNIKLPTDEE